MENKNIVNRLMHNIVRLYILPNYLLYLILSNPNFLNSTYNKSNPYPEKIDSIIERSVWVDYGIALFLWSLIFTLINQLKHTI